MSLEDLEKEIRLIIAKGERKILAMIDLSNGVKTVMDKISKYPGRAVEISIKNGECSLIIGSQSFKLRERDGFATELLMPKEKTDAEIALALRVIITEDKKVQTILALAASGNANIRVIDIEG